MIFNYRLSDELDFVKGRHLAFRAIYSEFQK